MSTENPRLPPNKPISEIPEWCKLAWLSDFLVPQACDGETEVTRGEGAGPGLASYVPTSGPLFIQYWRWATRGRLGDLLGPLRRQLSVVFSSKALTSSHSQGCCLPIYRADQENSTVASSTEYKSRSTAFVSFSYSLSFLTPWTKLFYT